MRALLSLSYTPQRVALPLRVLCLLCGVLSLLLYGNTLRADFAFDDTPAIRINPDVVGNFSSFSSRELFRHDYWGQMIDHPTASHRSYRPFTTLSFRVDFLLVGLQPYWFHAVNVLLNALVAATVPVLLVALSRSLHPKSANPGKSGASFSVLVASLLYCCHPVRSEAIANVAGRAELLSALISMWAVYFYVTHVFQHSISARSVFSTLLVCFMAFFAALCKESGITLLLTCAALDFVLHWCCQPSPLRLRLLCLFRVLVLASAGIGYLLFRFFITAGHTHIRSTYAFNPLLFVSNTSRFATALWIQLRYLYLLIFPFHLSCDYSFNSVPMLAEPIASDPRLFLIAVYPLLLLSGAVYALRKCWQQGDARMVSALCLYVFPLLPASHIVPIGTVMAERLLYSPALGFCCAVALLIEGAVFPDASSHPTTQISETNGDTKDTHTSEPFVDHSTLSRSLKEVSKSKTQESATSHSSGSKPQSRHTAAAARSSSQKSNTSTSSSTSTGTFPHVGSSQYHTGPRIKASSALRRQGSISWHIPFLVLLLSVLSFRIVTRNELWLDGWNLFEHDLQHNPQSVKLLEWLWQHRMEHNQLPEALAFAERAERIYSAHSMDSRANLGILARLYANKLAPFRNLTRASEYAERALHARVVGDDAEKEFAFAAKGVVLFELGRFEEALRYLRLAIDENKAHSPPFCFAGAALCQLNRIAEALPFLKRCVELKNTIQNVDRVAFIEDQVNYGQALYLTENLEEAEAVYGAILALKVPFKRLRTVQEDYADILKRKQRKNKAP